MGQIFLAHLFMYRSWTICQNAHELKFGKGFMRKIIFFALALFLSSLSFAETAQNVTQTNEVTWKDEIAAPFSTPGIYAFGSGMATAGILKLFFTDSVINEVRDRASANNSLGEWDHRIDMMGQLVPNALYALGMGAYGYIGDGNSGKENAIIMVKSTAYASLLTSVLKYSIRERRPGNGARNSFPSGHSTTAFAFASVVGSLHEWYYGVPAYALATLVAYQRLNSGVHFLQDVIAGASIGIAYGIGIADLAKRSPHDKSVFLPMPTSDGRGLSLNYLTTF